MVEQDALNVDAIRERGLLAPSFTLYRFVEETERAKRYHRPLSIAVVAANLAPGEHIDEETLASSGAEARKAVRRTDLVGWLDRASILLVMPETAREEAVSPLLRLWDELVSRTGREWHVALVEYAGEEAEELLDAALDRVRQSDGEPLPRAS